MNKRNINPNLFTKSSFNFFTSILKLEDILDFAIKNKYQNVGLIEENTMYLAYEFIKTSINLNLKPIFGLLINYKDLPKQVLFAKNIDGYYKLVKISSLINIDEDDKKIIDLLKDQNLITILNFKDFPFNSYIEDKDLETLNIFSKIGNKKLSSNIDKLLSIEEFILKYGEKKYQKIIEISDNISLKLEVNKKIDLPSFKLPVGFSDSKKYLSSLLLSSLKNYFKENIELKSKLNVYKKRLEYEFKIITEMNFTNYFLIVYDLILFARKQKIYVGPGRGSSAGSLISFLLNITLVDPIKNNLYFERFLNPERITMPDIDIDIEDERRDEVLNYLNKKYRNDYFAQIITFQSLKAKMSLKDVFRYLKISPSEANKVTQLLDDRATLAESFKKNKLFKYKIESDVNFKKGFETAMLLEGLPRQYSTHASGIVVSNTKISDIVPIQKGYSLNYYQTQYSMNFLEENGLLKFDLLGLRNLTFIKKVLNLIKKTTNKEIELEKISLDDKNIYQMLSLGDVIGIFQLESDGMIKVLKKIKPTNFEDIVATISLFRPGPIKQIDLYVARKNGDQKIEYIVPALKKILEKTYGIIVYQEQIMEIVQKIASFSLAKADILRRAIGKKDQKELSNLKDLFLAGAKKNGYSDNISNQIFNLIFEFASYGFNRSHAFAYSMISFWLSWLKFYYPQQFLIELLNSVIGNNNKTLQYLEEAKKLKIKIKYSNINSLNYDYYFDNGDIILALDIIKGLEKQTIRDLLLERKNGIFKDYLDFVVRAVKIKLTKNQIELLIKAGSLDNFNLTRDTMLNNLKMFIDFAKLVIIEKNNEVKINYDVIKDKPIIKEYPKSDYTEFEKEAFGFLFETNDILNLNEKLTKEQVEDLTSIKDINWIQDQKIKIFGIINSIQKKPMKNRKIMWVLELKHLNSKTNIRVWPGQILKYDKILTIGSRVIISGKLDLKWGKAIIFRRK